MLPNLLWTEKWDFVAVSMLVIIRLADEIAKGMWELSFAMLSPMMTNIIVLWQMFVPLQCHPRLGKNLTWHICFWMSLLLNLNVTSLESWFQPPRKYELSLAWSQVVMALITMSYIFPSCPNLATWAQLLVQMCGLKPKLYEKKKLWEENSPFLENYLSAQLLTLFGCLDVSFHCHNNSMQLWGLHDNL